MGELSQQSQHLFVSAIAKDVGSDVADKLVKNATVTSVPKGTRLFATGDPCENFVLILTGSARILLSLKSGREVTLFHLHGGQSCALTTSCLLTNSDYYAEGIAETNLEIVTVPASEFRSALSASSKWAGKLLEDYASRIGGLIELVDRLTSRDIDADLGEFLEQNKMPDGAIVISHKAIAEELGTAREVISRKLKKMEQKGALRLSRNKIQMLDND